MNPDVEKVLRDGEQVYAKVSGRVEAANLGGMVVVPLQCILLATDQRILYFVKVDKGELSLEDEFPFADVEKIDIYNDFFNGTLGFSKTLHIQNNKGDLIRLIAPENYENFISYVKTKVATH